MNNLIGLDIWSGNSEWLANLAPWWHEWAILPGVGSAGTCDNVVVCFRIRAGDVHDCFGLNLILDQKIICRWLYLRCSLKLGRWRQGSRLMLTCRNLKHYGRRWGQRWDRQACWLKNAQLVLKRAFGGCASQGRRERHLLNQQKTFLKGSDATKKLSVWRGKGLVESDIRLGAGHG